MNLFAVTIPIRNTVSVKYTSVGPLVSDALGLALSVGSVFAFGYLVYGGIQWILGSGDKAKIEEARGRITQAVMGLIIVAASWAIFLLISNFLGLGTSGGDSWDSSSSLTNNPNITTNSNSNTSTNSPHPTRCSQSSAAKCKGELEGYECSPGNICKMLESQPLGLDGNYRCSCSEV